MKIHYNSIEWGKSSKYPDMYSYYFQVRFLSKKDRKELKEAGIKLIGKDSFWYDGPHASLSLYFISFHWSTYYTKVDENDMEF